MATPQSDRVGAQVRGRSADARRAADCTEVRADAGMQALRAWTIGHSTHTGDAFVALLTRHGIAVVADIRAVPKSRRYPHFDIDALTRSLPERGVTYVHLARLGGWRHAAANSLNDAWKNASFRGYADYALGDEFAEGLAQLRELAAGQPTVMMCSEALWWRCHRRLVADHLVARQAAVYHITSAGRLVAHKLTPFAVVLQDGRITYPAVATAQPLNVRP